MVTVIKGEDMLQIYCMEWMSTLFWGKLISNNKFTNLNNKVKHFTTIVCHPTNIYWKFTTFRDCSITEETVWTRQIPHSVNTYYMERRKKRYTIKIIRDANR